MHWWSHFFFFIDHYSTAPSSAHWLTTAIRCQATPTVATGRWPARNSHYFGIRCAQQNSAPDLLSLPPDSFSSVPHTLRTPLFPCRWLATSRFYGANRPFTSRAKCKRPSFTLKCALSFPRWFRTRPSAMEWFRSPIRAQVRAATATERQEAAAPNRRPRRPLLSTAPRRSITRLNPCCRRRRHSRSRIRRQCCAQVLTRLRARPKRRVQFDQRRPRHPRRNRPVV